MAEFAADLRRHLNNTPILARPASKLRKLQLWSLRHPTLSAAGVTALLAMITISVLSVRIYRANRSLVIKTAEEQASAEEATRNLERALVVDGFLHDLLASPSPWVDGYDVTVASLLDQASVRLASDFAGTAQARTSLQVVLGSSYASLGLPEAALPLQEEALAALTQRLGPEDPETLQAMLAVGDSLISLDRWSEARELVVQAADVSAVALGQDHPTTSGARVMIAQVLLLEGHLEESEEVLRAVLRATGAEESLAEIRGPGALGLLARNLDLQARFEESGALFQEVIEERTSRFGEEHPLTIAAVENLANHFHVRGMFEEAEPLYERAYTTRSKRAGARHPLTLAAADNLGRLMVSLGRWSAAEDLFRTTLEAQLEVLGPRHSDTLYTMTNLGWSLFRQGKTQEAETLYREALSICRDRDAPPLFLVASLQTNLAQLLTEEDPEEAVALIREAIQWRTQNLGAAHPDTLSSQSGLAQLLEQQGALAEAETLWRAILDGYVEAFADEDNYLVLIAKNNLGWLLRGKGKLVEAEQLLAEALAGRIRTSGQAHIDTLWPMINLASVCNDLEQFERSAELYRDAVSIQRAVLGRGHPGTLWNMVDHGLVLMRAGRPGAAEEVMRTAMDSAIEAFGPTSIHSERPQHALGSALIESGKYEEAADYLRDALETRRAQQDKVGLLAVLDSAGAPGFCLAMLGEFEQAESLLIEMHTGLTEELAGEDTLSGWCVDSLVLLYERWGREADAARWRDRR